MRKKIKIRFLSKLDLYADADQRIVFHLSSEDFRFGLPDRKENCSICKGALWCSPVPAKNLVPVLKISDSALPRNESFFHAPYRNDPDDNPEEY